MPEDPADELAVAIADSVWAMGATGKFVWPIPDKGLKKRSTASRRPTLMVWGEHDRLVSPRLRRGVRRPISRTRAWRSSPDAGHVPQVERLDVVAPLVLDFLAA